MPGNEEASGEMDQVVKLSTSPAGSSSRRAAGWRRIAFSSGGEDEVAAELGDEERPDAEAVAREEELPLAPVPDGEGEVAVQPVEAGGAPLRVGLCDHLGVARGREPVAEALELRLQLDVVVDLAVLHHPVAAVLAPQRAGRRRRGRRWRGGCSSSRSARRGRGPCRRGRGGGARRPWSAGAPAGASASGRA